MSERQPGVMLDPALQEERNREMRQRVIEFNQRKYDALISATQSFLQDDTPIDLETLAEGKEAQGFLEYNDEAGYFSFGQSEYKAAQELDLYGDRAYERLGRVSQPLLETRRRATGRTRFMRGPHGDTSYTVPLALRREMQAAEIEQLRAISTFYRERVLDDRRDSYEHLDSEIKKLQESGQRRFSAVQEKANPYISADIEVAIRHSDEYERLRREFLRAGDNKKVYLVGIPGDSLARHVLTKLHPEEFAERLAHFQEHPEETPNLEQRNKLLESASKIDREWIEEHPYRD